ncbi:mannose-6-phosphate isomerase, class I [Mycetocola spongiae]|uniref:mannose-6-phosphate isomerase, class I n=1 Tax=Mycetocola spongiae TaxID=2859226 RepID=UPI001CF55E68|nr:mannose-6-phosphate isomerase, class I [Mycetocola spongiae]UCR90325.1 mannose-6-phosphate isomerase, class I [Mycetocola spongiae]
MFIELENTPRDYAWGARDAVSALLGLPLTGAREAELWMGAHAGSPARILAPEAAAAHGTLDRWIAADPAAAGLDEAHLPFLFKILAAGEPLSIQAHPDAAGAREGFERENAAGIALDDPARNYRDPYPKPELIVALEDGFEALSGFRPFPGILADLDDLLSAELSGEDRAALGALRARLASAGTGESELLRGEIVAALSGERGAAVAALSAAAQAAPDLRISDTVQRLATRYPGDPGILVALYLNRVTLARGESLFLDAGNVHAYLEGLGLELMTASDNVLRGGITPKHIDVAELLGVLNFGTGPAPYLPAREEAPGVLAYRPAEANFALLRLDPAVVGSFEAPGPAIFLQLSGVSHLGNSCENLTLDRGGICYLTPRENPVGIAGHGELWVATIAG